MTLPVLRTRQAEEDLLQIWLYIAQDNPKAADRLLDQFGEKCALLASSPLIGTPCPELAHELRFLIVGNYVLFYRADRDCVTVIRVLHGARDIGGLFGHP